MVEVPAAESLRAKLNIILESSGRPTGDPLTTHLLHGLAYTVGSALGCTPPPSEACSAAFLVVNKAGLTAGARAWSKHAHRSGSAGEAGWWGAPRGSVSTINAQALALFEKVVPAATWRNLHWLPHQVLVYEVRIVEGYGMRWSQADSKKPEQQSKTTRHAGAEDKSPDSGETQPMLHHEGFNLVS